jgi:multidrug transporter EmrE-like cation transporter
MLPLLMVFAVLALTVYGQLMMKSRALAHAAPVGEAGKLQYLVSMFSDVGVLSCLSAAVLAAVLWMLAIERLEVSYAYPFMALSFVLVPLGSMVLFGERLPPLQVLGLGLIVMGVTMSALAR